jgi:hypothetical protein
MINVRINASSIDIAYVLSLRRLTSLPFILVLYHRFPLNWPLHAPKDKIANWIEQYVDTQDLTVWTSSRPAEDSQPTYDEVTKRWTIVVDRCGQRVTLHPAHIICAMGTLGPRIMPQPRNSEGFKGMVIHGGDYKTPEPFRNKRVVVVGAGNTAGDICIDLSTCAESITMVQRSKSTLIPAEILRETMTHIFPDDFSIPTDILDFRFATTPNTLLREHCKITKAGGGGESGKYATFYKDLRKKGMIVDDGDGGEGTLFQLLEKFGGMFYVYIRIIRPYV